MTVSCPECTSVFRVDPAKVPESGVRARCSICGGVIAIGRGRLAVSVTPAYSTAAMRKDGPAALRTTLPFAAPISGVRAPAADVQALPALAADASGPRLTPTSSAATPPTLDGRRPINPFLHADPEQRARRLARALVSDLVAYHPKKRDDGLRDGTLRQLFREDIKKSYEEYAEQVGREVAEHSPHFQDALNDLLAGGRRLF